MKVLVSSLARHRIDWGNEPVPIQIALQFLAIKIFSIGRNFCCEKYSTEFYGLALATNYESLFT